MVVLVSGALLAAAILTLLVLIAFHLLGNYVRTWYKLKRIPGLSPTLPILGNALLFKPSGEGKISQRRPANSECHLTQHTSFRPAEFLQRISFHPGSGI